MRALAFHGMTELLPWMPRVVGSNFISAMTSFIYEKIHYERYGRILTFASAQAFGIMFSITVAAFLVCWYTRYRTVIDGYSFGPEAALGPYLLQVAFGCLSTVSGEQPP